MATHGSWPLHEFPHLTYGKNANHKITSCETKRYNCIAWASGDIERPWWPNAYGHYWPPGISETDEIPSFIEAFQLLGYTKCLDGLLEEGFEKVALFAHKDGTPTHAARQLKNGKWTSKLGPFQDIEHDLCHDVRGPVYGSVCCFMRRPITPISISQLILRSFRCIRVLCGEAYWRSRAFIKRVTRKNIFSRHS
jgi:hypothetical protein